VDGCVHGASSERSFYSGVPAGCSSFTVSETVATACSRGVDPQEAQRNHLRSFCALPCCAQAQVGSDRPSRSAVGASQVVLTRYDKDYAVRSTRRPGTAIIDSYDVVLTGSGMSKAMR
jgi:hypothetical protein